MAKTKNKDFKQTKAAVKAEEARKAARVKKSDIKGRKPPKKKLIVKPIEKQEIKELVIEIKKTDSYPKEHITGRKTLLLRMFESGEDKVVAQKIFILASKGKSRQDIRKQLEIKLAVWNKMMVKNTDEYPIYLLALDRGESYACEIIEESLKTSAMGYDYKEIHEGIDGDKIISKTITKHVKADVKAQMFFLTNKKPKEYKMKRTEEININIKKQEINWNLLPPDVLKMVIAAKSTEEIDKLVGNSVVSTVKKDD